MNAFAKLPNQLTSIQKYLVAQVPFLVTLLAFLVLLAACGGAGETDSSPDDSVVLDGGEGGIGGSGIIDGGDGGIGGSGIVAAGPIEAFGSVYVNGKCYETTDANITLNGQTAVESNLTLGAYIRVIGFGGTNSACGEARSVAYEPQHQGPIQAVAESATGTYKVISVLNADVLVHPDDTVFLDQAGSSRSFGDLSQGQWIRATGRLLEGGVLLATGITFLDATHGNRVIFSTQAPDWGVFTGTFQDVIDDGFAQLANAVNVTINNAEFVGFETGKAHNVGRITVKGVLQDNGIVMAQRIVFDSNTGQFGSIGTADLNERLRVEGEITDLRTDNGVSRFTVAGLDVLKECGACVSPEFLTLREGMYVAIEGAYAPGLLTAASVEVLDIVEEAVVVSVDSASNTIRLSLVGQGEFEAAFIANEETVFTDERDGLLNFSLSQLQVNDLVRIRGVRAGDVNVLEALTRVERTTGATSSDPAAVLSTPNLGNVFRTGVPISIASLDQKAFSTLEIIIGGKAVGEYGVVNATQHITLDGALIITADEDVNFVEGDQFTLFSAPLITGGFSELSLPLLPAGLVWDTEGLVQSGVISVVAAEPMIVWVDTNFSNSVSFRFYGIALGETRIDWGDGTPVETLGALQDGAVIANHDYSAASPGSFVVKIYINTTGFGWPRNASESSISGSVAPIVRVESWGNNGQLMRLSGAFMHHANLTQVPNYLPAVTSEINDLFNNAGQFNDPAVRTWNTQNIRQMERVFLKARNFNQDISVWDVSSVTTMSRMFRRSGFNQDIARCASPEAGWDVSNVIIMKRMFKNSDFNQDLSCWNTAKVLSFSEMFSEAAEFNQDIGGWDTGRAEDLSGMFQSALSFSQNLAQWDVTNVTDAQSMFDGATAFTTAHYDALLQSWSVQNVQANVPFGVGNTQYSAASATARAVLISSGWVITDGGQE